MSINLEYILKNSAGNLYWKDRAGKYQGANQTYMELILSQTKQNFLGKTDREIYSSVMSDEQLSAIENIDQRIMNSGKEENIREIGVNFAGEIATYITKKIPLRDEKNNVIGILGTSLDITKEVEAERRAKIFEASAEVAKRTAESEIEMRKIVMVLVGDIVHDLRTPIATIRTISSLLDGILSNLLEIADDYEAIGGSKINLLSKKKREAIKNKDFTLSLEKSVQMMTDFIDVSLLELNIAQKENHANLELIKYSSRRVLERAMESFTFDKSIKKHETISYDFELMGNSILIMKILFNLFRNASEQIQLIGKGEIYISTEAGNGFNYIKVKDTAGGVSPEVAQHLFKAYFTTKQHGTGIGLAHSKETMKKFGGKLTYDNIYGESLEFILAFPALK